MKVKNRRQPKRLQSLFAALPALPVDHFAVAADAQLIDHGATSPDKVQKAFNATC